MASLQVDWIATAVLAVCLGWAGPKSLKAAAGLSVLVGLVGWAFSYLLMLFSPSFGGDTALAEDYINGFGARNAALEIALALGWTFVWFGLARAARFVIGPGRKGAS
jgi:hypothetical protein